MPIVFPLGLPLGVTGEGVQGVPPFMRPLPRPPAASVSLCYRDLVLDDNPVSYWRFGEGAGATAIDSVGSNPGAYVASPTLGVAGAITGDPDTAVTLNGTTQYVTVADSASVDLGDGPFSIELWLKQGGTQRTMLSKGAGAYELAVVTNLYLSASGGSAIAHSAQAVDDSAWHHCVVTKNGAATRIYVDGKDQTVANGTATLINTATTLFIGGNGTTDFMSGSLDEVAIYNVVLTPLQVQAHYQAGISAFDCAWDPTMAFFDNYDITDDLAES